ncbi:LCCL domain-containing protein [Plasmodium brasilianum]|uniref:LCCL domain-containing protein n=1 Tax=Plasmodium brasilianum TaxID=5824 RepID=A0ACB9YH64_PLABR|nr:LCCL domain-containing protein [Plasmodium brasilianum]
MMLLYAKDPDISLGNITEFRQQHRKTLDGRLCAAAFLHDDQTYTDCTSAPSPDGTSGREWCYVEVQLLGKGVRDWDYCANTVNYDKLRLHAKKVFEEKSLEADRLRDRLHVLSSRVYGMLQKYDSVCGKKHELINNRIEKINEWLNKSAESIGQIENNSIDLSRTKNIIEELQKNMNNEKESLKEAEENCAHAPGYENEPYHDGLRVSYFNNSLFLGIPVESKIEKEINFSYNNRGPLDNLSPYKYSIRYEGFLLAPHSGIYTFIVETDCYVRLRINNTIILLYGLEEVETEGGKSTISLSSSSSSLYSNMPKGVTFSNSNDEVSNVVKKISRPIELMGGEKHSFLLDISHSSHLKYRKGESSSFKLFWKSSRIDEQVIQSNYFFSDNIIPPIRFSSLDAQLFDIGLVDVNESPFKDDKNWIISQIAPKYVSLHVLKTDISPQFRHFSFSVNTGCNLFIASPIDDIFPLSPYKDSLWKAYDTDDIVELNHLKTKKKKIFKIKFISLKHRSMIKFNVSIDIPFFIFSKQRKILPTVCSSDEEENLTSPDSAAFKECTQSSALSNEYNCIAALNSYHNDKKFTTWRTGSGSTIGEYIQIYFKKPVQVSKFRFKGRDNILTWPSEISLHFDDTEIVIPILYTSSIEYNTTKFEHPIITTSVKIVIRDMFMNNDETGGSFQLIGNSCTITDDDYLLHHAVIDITDCKSTLNNIPDVMPLLNGDKFLTTCEYHCIENLYGEVYGSTVYSPDSAICKAAVHAGICNEKNKQYCKFLIIINDKEENYIGNLQNNVLSLSQNSKNTNSAFSFSFSSAYVQNINKLYSSIPNSYSIVFKNNNDLNIPNKFLVDSGDVFTDYVNFAYGWKQKISFSSPFPSLQKSIYPNGVYSGGIDFPPASASQHCLTHFDCQANFWKFQTNQNGTFAVQVLVGNVFSNDNQKAFIEINGIPIIKNELLQSNEYFVAVKNVQVINRSIILTSTCLEEESVCQNAKTTIIAVQILQV